ncbi:MAG: hypothetical protein ACTSVY_12480 [Candidatus Helarchaeota archaeon]
MDYAEKEIKKYGKAVLEQSACMVPSTFSFSALKSITQNLKYKGKLWLTPTHLVFKGKEIISCGKISDISNTENNIEVPVELKKSDFELGIEVKKIKDIFVGHDELFGRRHLIFPKLRIATSSKIWYFLLFNENLSTSKSDVEQRALNFKDKIGKAKRGALTESGVPAPKVVKPKIVRPQEIVKDVPTPDVPIATVIENKSTQPDVKKINVEDLKKVAKKPTVITPKPVIKTKAATQKPTVKAEVKAVEKPQLKNIEKLKQKSTEPKAKPQVKIEPVKKTPKVAKKSVAEIIKDKQQEISSKKVFKITKVKPYESSSKTTYAPMAQVMKPTKIEEKEDKYLNDLLLDMTEEVDLDILEGELSQASADTSINRCPHCGWILAWNSVTCPKCKKRVDEI